MSEPGQRGRGRPTLLTPDLADKIIKGVEQGLPIEMAAALAGVSKAAVLEWVRRGEERDEERSAEPLYVDFANRYQAGRAKFFQFLMRPCIEAVAGVRPSRKKNAETGTLVKAIGAVQRANEARFHLARRFPEFYGASRESPAMVQLDMTSAMQSLSATPESARAAVTKMFGNVTPDGTKPDAAGEEPPRRPDDAGDPSPA